MKQYVVNVSIGYKNVKFAFGSITGACNFMELFLDHVMKTVDGDEISVYLERIDLPEKVESEDE